MCGPTSALAHDASSCEALLSPRFLLLGRMDSQIVHLQNEILAINHTYFGNSPGRLRAPHNLTIVALSNRLAESAFLTDRQVLVAPFHENTTVADEIFNHEYFHSVFAENMIDFSPGWASLRTDLRTWAQADRTLYARIAAEFYRIHSQKGPWMMLAAAGDIRALAKLAQVATKDQILSAKMKALLQRTGRSLPKVPEEILAQTLISKPYQELFADIGAVFRHNRPDYLKHARECMIRSKEYPGPAGVRCFLNGRESEELWLDSKLNGANHSKLDRTRVYVWHNYLANLRVEDRAQFLARLFKVLAKETLEFAGSSELRRLDVEAVNQRLIERIDSEFHN